MAVLKIGKLPTDVLKKCILDNISIKRPEVLVHSGIGEDCSIISFKDQCCVLSSDPITGSSSSIGRLAVHISCNDIASSGVEPVGILVTILAPEETTEQDIYDLMNEINNAASEIGVEILGGHTEVTAAVNKLVVSTTAVGKGPIDGYISSSGVQTGDSIIVTKFAGLEGTSIIANDLEDSLRGKVSREILDNAKGFISMISVVKEGMIGQKTGVTSMHDATEGGLLGAVWEIAEASQKGFEIYKDRIPIKHETEQICSILDLNPLKLISSGMMVMTTSDGEALLSALSAEGINAACIGSIINDKNRRVLISSSAEENVEPPEADELFKVK